MNREHIEKASNDYIGHPHEVDEGLDVFSSREAFKEGAEWRINSVWHTMLETPKQGFTLCINDNGCAYLLFVSLRHTKILKSALKEVRNFLTNRIMGCDIHLRLEIKAKKQSKWKTCHIFGYEKCWSDRVYGMFAVLAGVRNRWDMEHLPVRGLPVDASDRTLMLYGCQVADEAKYDWQYSEADAEGWVEIGYSTYYEVNGIKYCSCPYWHTPSWCTTSEMEDCINRIFKKDDGGWKGDYIEWLALLGAMKGYEQSGDYECRAVFWFDN